MSSDREKRNEDGGRTLVEHHQLFAFLKAPQRGREGANVHGLRGDVEQMRLDPRQLKKEHPDELPAPGNPNAKELFYGKAEGVLLAHRRDVVEPIKVWDGLDVGLVFDELLGPTVKKADMRIDALHHLAVELQHEAQD